MIPKDAADLIRQWDAGESIWTIEMLGLGPGYEQAIQVLAVEIVRDNLGNPIPTTDEQYRNWGNSTITRIDYKLPNGKWTMGGFSGAQVGAAKGLALRWLRYGPAQCHDSAPEDRRIQVSKFFPQAPDPPALPPVAAKQKEVSE